MAPPELAGNAPVVNIFHPIQVSLGKTLGHELDAAVFYHINGWPGQGLHLYKPLGAGQRFHDGTAAIAAANIMIIGLHFNQITLLFQILHNGFPCLIAVHAVVFAAVDDLSILIDALHLLQVVAQSDLIVVRVVAGSHLNGTGPEAEFHVVVSHDGELSTDQRKNRIFADEMPIALVIRMNCDAGIAQHGLRAGRGYDELFVGVLNGIADVPEMTGHILVLHFGVRERGAAVGAPVDDPAAFVDQAFLIQLTEGLAYGLGADIVHGEAVAFPVAGNTEAFLLLNDAVAVLVLPVPYTLQKLFTSQIIAGQAFLLAQFFLHTDLRGDAGVILTGQPKRGIALHALVAGQNILQRGVQRVAHMQLAGDVGWRHDNGEGLFLLVPHAAEPAALFPEFINP